tara:strand:+ start:117 stop:386 length:270 start_codon:yes stop_codon:yes gene_type:complete
MRESVIEKKVSDYAKLLGWLAYKFSSPQNAGVPDHIYFREGRTILIEFKAPGKKPSKLQVRHIERLEEQLIPVYVVDDIDKGKDIFNAY